MRFDILLPQLPYALNIVALAPVCLFALRRGTPPLADGYWVALLLCSGLGLMLPRLFTPVLILQWTHAMATLALLVLRRERAPGRLVPVLVAVGLVWPWFVWRLI